MKCHCPSRHNFGQHIWLATLSRKMGCDIALSDHRQQLGSCVVKQRNRVKQDWERHLGTLCVALLDEAQKVRMYAMPHGRCALWSSLNSQGNEDHLQCQSAFSCHPHVCIWINSIKCLAIELSMMAYTCNPSFLGGRGRRITL
jgi:hypothetical protein